MAVVTDRFVAGQVMKTGCTTTHERLGGPRPWGCHVPLHKVPADVRATRTVFATLRNPQTWYGSLRAHIDRRGPTFGHYGRIDPWPWGGLPMRDGVSLYTWAVRHLLMDGDRWMVNALVPTDRINEGLDALGVPGGAVRAHVDPEPSRYVVGPELAGAIAEQDGWLSALFGWDVSPVARVAVWRPDE